MTTTATRERPILFSAEMVCAILDGRKTQTRRVVKPQPRDHGDQPPMPRWGYSTDRKSSIVVSYPPDVFLPKHCPYGAPGDLLWVREAWADLRGKGFGAPFAYRANALTHDGREDADSKRCRTDFGVKWKPSIHMPREASRLTLRITEVRVERVQDISGEDSGAEGCQSGTRYEFALLWDSINAKRGFGWDANPWVWAPTVTASRAKGRALSACAA